MTYDQDMMDELARCFVEAAVAALLASTSNLNGPAGDSGEKPE